ncbi:MAG: hypothetical protein KDK23_06460 [Leptospiraceae bacterium]|nr:hypothetical protein [Leptospiraceae bacterium]
MKRFGAALLVVLMASPGALFSLEEKHSWLSIRFSQASWEPAVFNEIDKLRQTNLQDSAIFSGGLLATPADYFSYGNARQSMPLAEITLSIGGETNRGNISLGYGSTSPSGLSGSGFSYVNSQTFNILLQSNTNQFDIYQSGEFKHYRLSYDHEYYPFRDDAGFLNGLGIQAGLQLMRDEFNGGLFRTGEAQLDSGTSGSFTSSSISAVNSFGSTEHSLTTGALTLGLIYRFKLNDRIDMEAGAAFGAGKGQSNAILKSFSTLTLGTASFPFESASEYTTDGDLRSSKLHFGAAYRFTELFAINAYYSVTNRYYTPTSGTIKSGGLISIENPSNGPFYTQKDKMSHVGIEFQARFN